MIHEHFLCCLIAIIQLSYAIDFNFDIQYMMNKTYNTWWISCIVCLIWYHFYDITWDSDICKNCDIIVVPLDTLTIYIIQFEVFIMIKFNSAVSGSRFSLWSYCDARTTILSNSQSLSNLAVSIKNYHLLGKRQDILHELCQNHQSII